jgi:3'(2'), 5'-bisphosphate nucleotidase
MKTPNTIYHNATVTRVRRNQLLSCSGKSTLAHLIGSSLKICLVAEGEADICPRLGLTMEWDTGAAHAIVGESGKRLEKYKNNKFTPHLYNKKNLLNQWFVVS